MQATEANTPQTMSEKLCLKWNDFQGDAIAAFRSFKQNKEFADVTLACGDGQYIEAHKVILAATSPFFEKLLRKNNHPHPLIFMRGMKSEDLDAIIDFIYSGEASVYEENLDSFLSIAADFELKGLLRQGDDWRHIEEEVDSKPAKQQTEEKSKTCADKKPTLENLDKFVFEKQTPTIEKDNEPREVSGYLQELDERVKSMMKKSQSRTSNGKNMAFICNLCGKEGYYVNIRDHIEVNHLEGISLLCSMCGNDFNSRRQLRRHKCKFELL